MAAWCPECGELGGRVVRPADGQSTAGPGDDAVYRCEDCGAEYVERIPEPSDGLPAEAWAGGFAENH